MSKYLIGPISPVKLISFSILAAAVLLSAAVFNFARAELSENVTIEQIDAALEDLSDIYGQEVTTQEQAKEVCNMNRYITDCAEIGRKHDLFPSEKLAQVDTILEKIKGQAAEQIKNCQDIECLVGVAQTLATKIFRENPTLASQIDLTPAVVREKKQIVEIAKSAGLTIDQCVNMDPDTASVEILRGCARLAKEDLVKKYVPTETRAQIDQISESTERTVQLKQALEGDQYQCGDNTIEGCGNFCLNPSTEARAAGTSVIPPVCRELAVKFFGPQGVRELESAYSKVSGVADYYYKKAQNFVFTTLDGQTLTSPDQIGQYMEEQGRAGNVEAVSKGMDFMVVQGFATQADKDFALKMVSKFRERGGVTDFDACSQDPKACKDFIHDDFQDSFDVMDQVFEIMRAEIGFDPNLCEQGAFDQSIGLKCLEGGKRALPKIEALAATNPDIRFIAEEIKSHLNRGDQLAQKKDQFRGGTFAGPGGCRDERECFVYCSNSANGPECIAFGAKEGLSGFKGEEAVQKYQQYEYTLNRSAIEDEYIIQGSPLPYPQGPYGPVPYGPPPYPFYESERGSIQETTGIRQTTFNPSPECVQAIKSGDFVTAKQVCNVGIGGPGIPPFPTNPPICSALPYVECPAGQYHESFRNRDGCFIDGPCKPIPSYSPGPYPTGPYPTYTPGPGSSTCSKSLISLLGEGCHQMYSDSSGRQIYCDGPMSRSAKEGDTATTPGCSGGGPGPYPTYTPSTQCNYNNFCDQGEDGAYCRDCAGTPYPNPSGTCPSGYHYHGEQGGFCMNDREDYSGTCYSADGKTTIKCPSQPTGQCTPPQWWDPAKGYCVGSTSPSPWPSPGASSCPAGYHYHGESGGFCMNDREDYSGTCYTADGKNQTTCPRSTYPTPFPTSSPTSSGTCPGGSHIMYVNNAGGYCMSDNDSSKCGPLNSNSTSNFGSCSSYQTTPTTTYTPVPSCPSGQWWDYANNFCRTDCASGTFWDQSAKKCVSSTTGGATYTPYPSSQTCPSGQWWDSATSSCKSTYPSCAPDQVWDSISGTCKSSTSTTYTPYPSYTPYSGYCGDNVCSSSETSSSCPSDCGGGVTSYTPYPTTQYTPYPTTEYTPPPSTYTPPPYSPPPESPPPPPPTSGALYNHFASLHCTGLGRVWDGQYCQPDGFIARAFENTWANLVKILRP